MDTNMIKIASYNIICYARRTYRKSCFYQKRTAESCNVRVRNDINEDFIQISKEFQTEDEAIQYCIDNDLDNKYKWIRIYSDKGLHISGCNEIVISWQ